MKNRGKRGDVISRLNKATVSSTAKLKSQEKGKSNQAQSKKQLPSTALQAGVEKSQHATAPGSRMVSQRTQNLSLTGDLALDEHGSPMKPAFKNDEATHTSQIEYRTTCSMVTTQSQPNLRVATIQKQRKYKLQSKDVRNNAKHQQALQRKSQAQMMHMIGQQPTKTMQPGEGHSKQVEQAQLISRKKLNEGSKSNNVSSKRFHLRKESASPLKVSVITSKQQQNQPERQTQSRQEIAGNHSLAGTNCIEQSILSFEAIDQNLIQQNLERKNSCDDELETQVAPQHENLKASAERATQEAVGTVTKSPLKTKRVINMSMMREQQTKRPAAVMKTEDRQKGLLEHSQTAVALKSPVLSVNRLEIKEICDLPATFGDPYLNGLVINGVTSRQKAKQLASYGNQGRQHGLSPLTQFDQILTPSHRVIGATPMVIDTASLIEPGSKQSIANLGKDTQVALSVLTQHKLKHNNRNNENSGPPMMVQRPSTDFVIGSHRIDNNLLAQAKNQERALQSFVESRTKLTKPQNKSSIQDSAESERPFAKHSLQSSQRLILSSTKGLTPSTAQNGQRLNVVFDQMMSTTPNRGEVAQSDRSLNFGTTVTAGPSARRVTLLNSRTQEKLKQKSKVIVSNPASLSGSRNLEPSTVSHQKLSQRDMIKSLVVHKPTKEISFAGGGEIEADSPGGKKSETHEQQQEPPIVFSEPNEPDKLPIGAIQVQSLDSSKEMQEDVRKNFQESLQEEKEQPRVSSQGSLKRLPFPYIPSTQIEKPSQAKKKEESMNESETGIEDGKISTNKPIDFTAYPNLSAANFHRQMAQTTSSRRYKGVQQRQALQNKSQHSSIERSISIEDFPTAFEHFSAEKPIVQRGSNVFAPPHGMSLPPNSDPRQQLRPKTASIKNKQPAAQKQLTTISSCHPNQVFSQKQAYVGLTMSKQSNQAQNNLAQSSSSLDPFVLRGDGFKQTKANQNVISDIFTNGMVSHATKTDQSSQPLATGGQVAEKSQFKIKSAVSKRKVCNRLQSANQPKDVENQRLNSVRKSNRNKADSGQQNENAEIAGEKVTEDGRHTPFMSYIETFIEQHKKMLEEEKLLEEDSNHVKTPPPAEKVTQSYNEYKLKFKNKQAALSNQKAARNTRLFAKNFIVHEADDVNQISYQPNGDQAQPSKAPQFRRSTFQRNLSNKGEHRQLFKYTIETKKDTNTATLTKVLAQQQLPINNSSAEQSMLDKPFTPQATAPIVAVPHRGSVTAVTGTRHTGSAAQHTSAYQGGSATGPIDDQQSLKCLLSIVRSVQQRADDIHLIRQNMDTKLRKIRHVNIEMFDEIKGREIARLTRENGLFTSLHQMKQTDSVMTKRQLMQGCKKIFKVFWNLIESEEEAQEVVQMQKYSALYMASELNLLQVLTEKGEKVQIFKKGHALQAKLFEAIFREKDFEFNICVALGVQKARQTFVNEVQRAAQVHIQSIEPGTGSTGQIKRAVRAMTDAVSQRRIKIATVSIKVAKLYELLTSQNQEVFERRNNFKEKYKKRHGLDSQKEKEGAASPARKQNQQNGRARYNLKSASISPIKNIKSSEPKIEQKRKGTVCQNSVSKVELLSSANEALVTESKYATADRAHKQIQRESTRRSLEQTGPRQSNLNLRKYKWSHLYQIEKTIGFDRSFALKNKEHLKGTTFSLAKTMTGALKADLEECYEKQLYHHYSMKKGSEFHLTLIIESRVLKIQRLARCFFKVRTRAAKKLQEKLPQIMTNCQRNLLTASALLRGLTKKASKSRYSQMTAESKEQKATIQTDISHLAEQSSQARKIEKSTKQANRKNSKKRFRGKQDELSKKRELKAMTSAKQQESAIDNSLEDKPRLLNSILYHSLRSPISSNLLLRGSQKLAACFGNNDNSEQQGSGVQTLQRDLWGYYGQQNLAKIIFLQRAIKKFTANAISQRKRLELILNYKHAKLQSRSVQQNMKAKIFDEIKQRQLPSAGLDSYKLEVLHGLNFHGMYLTGYFQTKVKLQANQEPLDGTDDERLESLLNDSATQERTDEQLMADFWSLKAQSDIKERMHRGRCELLSEHKQLRRQLFVRQLLKDE